MSTEVLGQVYGSLQTQVRESVSKQEKLMAEVQVREIVTLVCFLFAFGFFFKETEFCRLPILSFVRRRTIIKVLPKENQL